MLPSTSRSCRHGLPTREGCPRHTCGLLRYGLDRFGMQRHRTAPLLEVAAHPTSTARLPGSPQPTNSPTVSYLGIPRCELEPLADGAVVDPELPPNGPSGRDVLVQRMGLGDAQCAPRQPPPIPFRVWVM